MVTRASYKDHSLSGCWPIHGSIVDVMIKALLTQQLKISYHSLSHQRNCRSIGLKNH
jgi:hypothetical protein